MHEVLKYKVVVKPGWTVHSIKPSSLCSSSKKLYKLQRY